MKKTSNKKRTESELLKLTIEALDPEGVGVARHAGKTVLIPGALAGETVLTAVEHEGRTHIFTRLQKVLRRSPQRTSNQSCAIEQSCGACPLLSMGYPAQLDFKQQRVERALAGRNLLRDGLVAPTLPSDPPFGYRASAKLVFGRRREKVLIGLYQRGSHQVIACPECPVHHPLINRIAAVVREEVERQGISVYSPKHRNGLLRYLLVRVSPVSGKALVTLVSSYRDLRQLPKLGKWLMRKVPEVIGVHQNINSSTGNVIIGQETLKLHGVPDLIEQLGEIRLRIAPEAFFQVNSRQAARIYAIVRDWAQLSKTATALDLFCGIGGIALHLAQDAGRVFGIEVVAEAVRNAADNARLNDLDNCRFLAGDAGEELQRLAGQLDRLTLATLNPPRKGCEEALLAELCALQPEQIIYVSCDPDSLARDLAYLVTAGYALERVQPVDMFPQTVHVETVVQLRRQR